MKKLITLLLVLLFAVGCTTYHKVTDLNTGDKYYTKKIKYTDSGAVTLKDEKTGAKIVLPSSKVEKITKVEFNREAR